MDEKDAEFKITERLGIYRIYKKTQRKKGIFIKRIISEWRIIDICGLPICSSLYQIPLLTSSLEEAEQMVESLKRGKVITYF